MAYSPCLPPSLPAFGGRFPAAAARHSLALFKTTPYNSLSLYPLLLTQFCAPAQIDFTPWRRVSASGKEYGYGVRSNE